MTRPYKPIDTTRLTTYSIQDRRHKATVSDLALLPNAGCSAAELLAAFPDTLGAAAFRCIVNAIVDALARFGIDNIDMPTVPEKVWRIVKNGRVPARNGVLEDGLD